jgi:hypothetical protein
MNKAPPTHKRLNISYREVWLLALEKQGFTGRFIYKILRIQHKEYDVNCR